MVNYHDSEYYGYNYTKEQVSSRDNSSYPQDTPTCAEYLNNALHVLFCSHLKGFFIPSTFTLYSQNAYTAPDATTIKSLPSSNSGLIEYSDMSSLSFASLCNLIGFSFILKDASENIGHLASDLSQWASSCKYPSHISCNDAKAQRLRSSLDTVSLQVSGSIGLLEDVTVLAVAENAVWVAETFSIGSPPMCKTRIYVICLDAIEFIS